MQFWTAAALLAALAAPAAAEPLDTLQFRATLRTDQPTTAGPLIYPGQTAYLLGDSPAFGVVAAGVPDWNGASPAYPSAGFAVVGLGSLTAFTAAGELRDLDLEGGGRYALDVEFRDAAGRVGGVSFAGPFAAGWEREHGWAHPDLALPGASFWLGRTRYDVELGYGWPPSYEQGEDGQWFEVGNPSDSFSAWDGAYYWTEGDGGFVATVTATSAPEPGTLALAALGLGVAAVVRRRRPTMRAKGGA